MDAKLIKNVTVADVYKGDIKAATLTRDSTSVTFEYLPQYLASGGAPVAHTLPITAGASSVRTENGALPAFFVGLLPEGFRFSELAQELKVSASDEFRLLLAVGRNVPGDVRVVPQVPGAVGKQQNRNAIDDDNHVDNNNVEFEADQDVHYAEVDVDAELDFSRLRGVVDSVSLPGVQAKVSAGRSRRAVTASGRGNLRPTSTERSAQQYILKYDTPTHPLLCRNEHAHLEAAKKLGIPVESASIVTDIHGTDGLLADRFDRIIAPRDTRITRLAMEDASQLLNLPPAAKYDPSSEEVALSLVDVCNAKPVARRNIFLQTAFAYLTGNGDLHAKNYSVLQGLDGTWTLAPVYDVACTLVYGDKTMALSVAGRTKDLRLGHWLEFAQTIGLPEKSARAALKKALAAAERINLGEVGFHASTLNGARRLLTQRHDQAARDLNKPH